MVNWSWWSTWNESRRRIVIVVQWEAHTIQRKNKSQPWLKELMPRPHYAGGIWLKNAAFSLRLGLPSTLNSRENRFFRKRSLNQRNLKSSVLRFGVDGKQFQNKAFEKRWRHDDDVISIRTRVFFKHKSRMRPVNFAFFCFTGVMWRENIWCVSEWNLRFWIPPT